MSDVHTILLIPAEGSTLLDDPCAPTMWREIDEWGENPVWHRNLPGQRPDEGDALILAESGKVQRHGVLCLSDYDNHGNRITFDDVDQAVHEALTGEDGALCAFLDRRKYIRWCVVCLDGAGQVVQ